jgi:hypothetical protein
MSKKQYYLFLDTVIVGIIPTICLLIIELASGSRQQGGSVLLSVAVVLLPAVAATWLYYRQVSGPPDSQPVKSASLDMDVLRSAISEALKAGHDISGKQLEESLKHAADQRTETLQAFKQLSQIVATLRNAVDEREAELKRYKKNHDAELYRKFLRRIIDICESAQDAAAANPDKPEIGQIKELSEFLLEECEVKAFMPVIGALYREEFGVADSPRYVANTDPTLARRIARVIRPGYELLGGEMRQLIIPAKVEVFDDVKTEAPSN